MANPIVIAYHLIWTAYGTWLSNDPRGAWSDLIESELIAALGPAHHGRKRVQPAWCEVADFYDRAANTTRFPVLRFDAPQIAAIGEAFAETIAAERYTCYACAVMPDHVHILIRKHKHQAEDMIERLQSSSRSALNFRSPDHPVWTNGGWKVFLDHPDEIRRTMGYVDGNTQRAAMPPQRWGFVTPYDGWPLHPGHSPNSPYAKALRAAGRYP